MSSIGCQVSSPGASSPQKRDTLDHGAPDFFHGLSPASLDSRLNTTKGPSLEEEDASGHIHAQPVKYHRDEGVKIRSLTKSVSLSESRTTSNDKSKNLSIAPHSEDGSDTFSVHSLKHHGYLDPTLKTPCTSSQPSPTPSKAGSSSATEQEDKEEKALSKSSHGLEKMDHSVRREEAPPSDTYEDSKSEIQSIMDQFENDPPDRNAGPISTALTSSTDPSMGSTTPHPPRKSSLEPIKSTDLQNDDPSQYSVPLISSFTDGPSQLQNNQGPQVSPSAPSKTSSSLPTSSRFSDSTPNTPSSPNSSLSLRKPLPPEPDPEPDLPFDFHRFLEQLRHRTADPVAKFLRSFLVEFGKKQWMVHEQVKLISDFLAFITNKMSQCEVWRGVSDAEFDNAKEGMEKLVMNRLYSQTFSPVIPLPGPVPSTRGKKKNLEKLQGPGRRGQHQEDIERDEILGQKVRIYGWVQEEHLDIAPVGDSGRRFLALAQQGE